MIIAPAGAILRWTFPKQHGGETSTLIEGLQVRRRTKIGGIEYVMHFVCADADEARGCKNWSVTVHSVHSDAVILQPAPQGAQATHDGFDVIGGDVVLVNFRLTVPIDVPLRRQRKLTAGFTDYCSV